MMRGRSAFTLVEILLVSTLIAGISLAVFSCLSNGLKLWDRSRTLMLEEDAAFFFDRFAQDLRNSFPFSTLAFTGSEHAVAFPSMVMTRMDRSGSRAAEGYADSLGSVQYVFDAASGSVIRNQSNYSQALHGMRGDSRVVLKGLKDLRFKFYLPGSAEHRLAQDASDPFPAGVEVDLWFMDGTVQKKLNRFMPILSGI